MPAPEFPEPEGFFQNCQEKHFYRTGDYTLAHKLAAFVVAGMRRGEESRAAMIDAVTSKLMHFRPGQRYVVGPGGTREEQVPLLESPWPDWFGLREAKVREKLCQIYARPEYKTPEIPPSGDQDEPPCSTSSSDKPPPQSSAPLLSPAQLWKQSEEKPADGSPDSGGED